MAGSLDFEEVRLFVMDRAVEDNAIDLVANYFSDEEILAAMKRTAQHYNEIPPYVRSLVVSNTNTLPYSVYLLNGVAYYLYLSKLQKLAKEDLDYKAGGFAVDLVGKRMKHFQTYLKAFREEFIQGAQTDKIASNYQSAYGSIG